MVQKYAFYECCYAKEIVLQEGVTKIEEGAFLNCFYVPSVALPSSIAVIEKEAFKGCDALTEVSYPASQEEWTKVQIGENNGMVGAYHKHQYELTLTVPAAYMQAGRNEYTCSICSKVLVEEIPALPYRPGDTDLDGRISAEDARLALRRAVELETFAETSLSYRAADVDCSGTVTAADARLILRAAVGLGTLS